MHGPPGNGKTISIKAIMKDCLDKGFAVSQLLTSRNMHLTYFPTAFVCQVLQE
jgi:DNA replication protein DnaC